MRIDGAVPMWHMVTMSVNDLPFAKRVSARADVARGTGFKIDVIVWPPTPPHGRAVVTIDGRPYAAFGGASGGVHDARVAAQEAVEMWREWWPAAATRTLEVV